MNGSKLRLAFAGASHAGATASASCKATVSFSGNGLVYLRSTQSMEDAKIMQASLCCDAWLLNRLNPLTGANAGGSRLLPIRTRSAARVAQFSR